MEAESFEFSLDKVKEEPAEDFVLELPPFEEKKNVKPSLKLEEIKVEKCDRVIKNEPGEKCIVISAINNKTICPKKITVQHIQLQQKQQKPKEVQNQRTVFAISPEQAFECDKCGRFFSSSLYLRVHQTNAHNANPYKCDVCKNKFKNKFSLYIHGLSHSADKPLECEICEKNFRSKAGLKYHQTQAHPKASPSMAQEMVKKRPFRSPTKLPPNTKSFDCDLCGFKAEQVKWLENHMSYKHRNGDLMTRRGRPAKDFITILPTEDDISQMPKEVGKQLVHRIRNNVASRKCRMKARMNQQEMEDKCDKLSRRRHKLMTKAKQLEGQIEILRDMLVSLK